MVHIHRGDIMTKVYAGVIALVLLLGFAWVSFDNQRVKVSVEVTVQPASPVVTPYPKPGPNPLLAVTPRPLTEESLLPTITPNPSVGSE